MPGLRRNVLHGNRKLLVHLPAAARAGRRRDRHRTKREQQLMEHFIGAIAHIFSIFIVRRQG